MTQIAVSSWALHRSLGVSYPDSPEAPAQPRAMHGPRELPLLELPGALARHGLERLELCHFHLPSRDPAYLLEFRTALELSGVTLQTLLIDHGDISDPVHGERDAAWIAGWLDTAALLGAQGARVIAGKHRWTPDTSRRSIQHLRRLADHATSRHLRLRTENWFGLLSTPEHVLELLDRAGEQLGLCLDFGNWAGSGKYRQLAVIAPRAETCHAKAEFLEPAALDTDDLARCLSITLGAGFGGPYVIVNGGVGDDEWQAVGLQRDFIVEFLARADPAGPTSTPAAG